MKKKIVIITLVIITLFASCNRDASQSAAGQKQTPTAGGTSAALNAKVDTTIPEDTAAVILKHFAAIENGDLTAFRSTLKPAEDGADMNYQLSLICKYFGDFFNVSEAAFNKAFSDGGEALEQIRHSAFSGVFPAKSRNTGMFVKEMEMEQDFIKVTVSNNKSEESIYRLTYYDGGMYEGKPLVGIDRYLLSPQETSFVSSQDASLVFPQKINLFRYDSSFANRSPHGFPNTRIWGWSKNGKIAYSIESAIDGRGGQIIEFVVLDLITDKTVFVLEMDSFDHNDIENEALYNVFKTEILSAQKEYDIVQEGTQFLPFPFTRNNTEYNARFIDIEYKDDDLGFFEKVVTGYKVSVTANTKSKIVNTFVPLRIITSTVYLCGYILSPFENRMMVVIAEESWVHEGTEMFYRFAGCHLGVGFN